MIESYIWINLLIDYDILPMTSYRQFLHKTTKNDEFYQNESNFIKKDQQIFPINFLFCSLRKLTHSFIKLLVKCKYFILSTDEMLFQGFLCIRDSKK